MSNAYNYREIWRIISAVGNVVGTNCCVSIYRRNPHSGEIVFSCYYYHGRHSNCTLGYENVVRTLYEASSSPDTFIEAVRPFIPPTVSDVDFRVILASNNILMIHLLQLVFEMVPITPLEAQKIAYDAVKEVVWRGDDATVVRQVVAFFANQNLSSFSDFRDFVTSRGLVEAAKTIEDIPDTKGAIQDL